jgi:hypothetical protein
MKTTKSTITTTLYTSEDDNHTFEIRKETGNDKQKVAVIIMLYPGMSSKDMNYCDNTTQSIIDHMPDLEVGTVRILNLFSKVCSARMSTRSIKVDQDNLKYIESVMKEKNSTDYIWIFAWGSSMSSCAVANQTKRTILDLIGKHIPEKKPHQLTVDGLEVKSENAVHPLFLKIRYGNCTWQLEDYVMPKELNGEPVKESKNVIKDIRRKGQSDVLQNSK